LVSSNVNGWRFSDSVG